MSYKIESFENFYVRIKDLNCKLPETLSFLPENFSEANSPTDFIYSDTVNDVIKIFRTNEIMASVLDETNPRFRTRKNNDWLGPGIFIGFSLLTENSYLVTMALNVLSNYLTDLFKGSIQSRSVKFELVIETRKNVEFKKITYDGGVEGIIELVEIIKSLK